MHTFHSLRAALTLASGRLAHAREILRATDEFIRPYPSDYHFDTQNQHYIDSMMLLSMREVIDFLHAQLDANERDHRTIDVIVGHSVGNDVAEILRELQEIGIRDAILHTSWNSVLVAETPRPRMRRNPVLVGEASRHRVRLADITNQQ